MGRWSTGAETTIEIQRIELTYLIKNGFIQKDAHAESIISWTDNSRVRFESCYTKKEKWIRLIYTLTDRDGAKYNYDYKIYLTTVPSNLGKGEVLYFICPYSGERCRILYRAYGYHKWKCRNAYRHRIYYPNQQNSKLNRANDKFWQLERALDKIYQQKYIKPTYDGKPTKKWLRIKRMEEERDYYDWLRWTPEHMPKSLWG